MADPRTSPRNNLPRDATSFVGREHEIAEVRKLFSGTRLLTLVGAGGIGKTRLALKIGASTVQEYVDGVWVAAFADLSEPGLVVKTVASVLSVPEQADHPLMETLTAHVSSSSLLLVLDNCEHLLSACARLASALLRDCPKVHILTTSREALGIAGEVTYRVPALSLPKVHDAPGLRNMPQYEAIRLFVERARSSDPEFVLTESNAAAVAQVCFRLDGIPLAIELAAARTKVLAPSEIARRLDDQFKFLRGGPRDAPQRHQSLHAAISWSYELLTAQEQRLFRRLAVFRGGFVLESAEAVLRDGEGDVLDGLSSLIDKSLLSRTTTSAGTPRFQMLETIREYGFERLAAEGELEQTKSQHAHHFATLAQQTYSRMWLPTGEERLHRLWSDVENVRAAVDWSVRNSPETAARLGGGLGWLFYHHGRLEEGAALLEDILHVVADVENHLRSHVLLQAGVLAWGVSKWDEARARLEEALVQFRRYDDSIGQAMATAFMGHVNRSLGKLEEATEYYQTALSIYRRVNNDWGIGWALFDLARVARDQSRDDEALALHEQSLTLFRTHRHPWGMAWQLWSLGVLAHRRGDDAHAREHFAESLMLYRAFDDRRGIAQALEGFASVAFTAGRFRETARVLAAAEAVRAGAGAPLPFSERQQHERMLDSAKASMSPEDFEREWNSGRRLRLDEAIQVAEDSARSTVGRTRVQKRSPDGLTSREREVAALVARGLSNREIATRLNVAERTAISHVEHIMNKLRLHSRAQIAAWAVRHELDVSPES